MKNEQRTVSTEKQIRRAMMSPEFRQTRRELLRIRMGLFSKAPNWPTLADSQTKNKATKIAHKWLTTWSDCLR